MSEEVTVTFNGPEEEQEEEKPDTQECAICEQQKEETEEHNGLTLCTNCLRGDFARDVFTVDQSEGGPEAEGLSGTHQDAPWWTRRHNNPIIIIGIILFFLYILYFLFL